MMFALPGFWGPLVLVVAVSPLRHSGRLLLPPPVHTYRPFFCARILSDVFLRNDQTAVWRIPSPQLACLAIKVYKPLPLICVPYRLPRPPNRLGAAIDVFILTGHAFLDFSWSYRPAQRQSHGRDEYLLHPDQSVNWCWSMSRYTIVLRYCRHSA